MNRVLFLIVLARLLPVLDARCLQGYIWDGVRCRMVTCTALVVPNASPWSGQCSTASLTYQTRCKFTCDRGYILKGSQERVCQLDGTWSGLSTTCEVVMCPPLPKLAVGQYTPSECDHQAMRFDTHCLAMCPSGYMIQGTHAVANSRVCQVDGKWGGNDASCKDIEPPRIECIHTDITLSAEKGKNTAHVAFKLKVSDNSQFAGEPGAAVHVTSSHDIPGDFPIGRTYVKFTATDNAGNTRTCGVRIHVKDDEPPQFSFCPSNLITTSKEREMRVNWAFPIASDNSGLPPAVSSNFQRGSVFIVPGTYEVHTTAVDDSGNSAVCSFTITLKMETCKMYPAPINGALACTTDASSPICSPLCKQGFDFASSPSWFYVCSGGTWQAIGFPSSRWPDCSVRADPSSAPAGPFSPYQYFTGSADDPNTQSEIKTKFRSFLSAIGFGHVACHPNPACTEDNIRVFVGQQPA